RRAEPDISGNVRPRKRWSAPVARLYTRTVSRIARCLWLVVVLVPVLCADALIAAHAGEPTAGRAVPTAHLPNDSLSVTFLDNAHSPKILSGIDSLFHRTAAPAFDAFDPDDPGASAGLNFEHVIAGHRNAHNAFAPRRGRYDLYELPGGNAVRLVRRAED